ncbi:MAG TPA: Gfo/Idh/MocA family oxidoreductase [Acidobacteriota bacterium]|nr:Gfo/Idh/MocA family oxidoreductase [Acidobacteriota bacterium]
MRRVNIAMIGYAFMGKAHSNGYRQVNAFFDTAVRPHMKVICGRNEENTRRAAEKYGWEEYAADWRQVVERKDIDVVDICTPGDSHRDIAVAAAAAGKIVFCEKPLANTLAEAEEMYKAVKKAGVLHMICHNYRKVPAVLLARQMIAEGKLGKIHHFRGAYLQDWIVDPDFPLVWRLDKKKAGSGALGDIGSHNIDLARFLVGEITEVSGLLETFVKERPLPDRPKKKGKVTVDDAALALLRFEGGAVGTVEGTRFATGRKNANRFEINGSKGSLVFDLERLNELQFYSKEDPEGHQGFRTILVTEPSHPYLYAWWPPGHMIGYEHTFTHAIHDLMEAIDRDELPSPNFEDGLKNQRVLDAVERSSRDKKWLKIKK